ncbi:MAG: hypothetical protein J0M10_04445 [Chitinophagales bacterium]|nr:hypothetical protein [Chitinophagales bacterium]
MANKWNKKDTYVIERHPFGSLIFPGIKILIIGTFPTNRDNFRYEFFYSAKDNLFWKVLEDIYKHTFLFDSGQSAVIERKDFLKKKNIGITDMYEMCYRRNSYSTDENLFPIILTDIFKILDNHNTIERIIFTSRTEVFGAFGLFKTYLLQRNQIIPEMIKFDNKILEGKLKYGDKEIKLFVPYSPSPRLIANGRITGSELVSMYKYCLT